MSNLPPKWPLRFLEWFCPPQLLEEIEGDLLQRFERDVRTAGMRRAKLKMIWNVIRFVRPGIVLRNKWHQPFMKDLLTSHFLLAFRMLRKNSVFTVLNIAGLTVGIAALIFMIEYVRFEKSYDQFFPQHENIFRLQHSRFTDNQLLYSKAMSFPEVGLAIKESFAEVEAVGRLFPISTNIEPVFTAQSSVGNKSFPEPDVFLADSGFLQVFQLEVLYGDRSTALAGKNRVMISESAALKYFDRTGVVGESLRNNLGHDEVVITAVFRDLPPNSHLKFDMLMSWFDVYGEQSRFTWDGFYNYLLLRDGTDRNEFAKKMDAFADRYFSAHYANQKGSYSRFTLQPLTDIHLRSHLEGEIRPNGHYATTLTLSILAGLITIISLINYINLTTSRSLDRLKEVGIRKVMGSSKGQLAIQFLSEAFIAVSSAFVLGIITLFISYPYLNDFFKTSVTLDNWQTPTYWMLASVFLLAATLVSGFYPAFILSRFRTFESVRNQAQMDRVPRAQMILVGVQLGIALFLITASYILFTQLNFMQTQNLGFAMNQKLVLKLLPGYQTPADTMFQYQVDGMKASLENVPFTKGSTLSSSIPGRKNEWRGRSRLAGNDAKSVLASLTRIDKDFLPTFEMKLVAGTNYKRDNNNETSIIINEEAARQLGFEKPEDAVGKKMMTFREREIIGVVASFHESGLREGLSPSLFITGEGYAKFLTISLDGPFQKNQLETIHQVWSQHFSGKPFEYFFLDDFFNRQYERDVLATRSALWFAGVAIFLTCLGLIALMIQNIHRKTKEIGIRKILGASTIQLAWLLTRIIATPALLTAIVAIPISKYLAEQWLGQYAYRIEVSWLQVLIPYFGLLAVALGATLTQTVNAAQQDPVKCLRND